MEKEPVLKISAVRWLRQMGQLMTKPPKWHVRPVKTQISLGIRPIWSESSLSAWRKLGSLATYWVDIKDSADDQTGRMPRLIPVFAGRTVILMVLSCGGSNGECDQIVLLVYLVSSQTTVPLSSLKQKWWVVSHTVLFVWFEALLPSQQYCSHVKPSPNTHDIHMCCKPLPYYNPY